MPAQTWEPTGVSLAEELVEAGVEAQQRFLESLTPEQAESLKYDWDFWARPKQKIPPGDWFCWLRLAGRGEGKTRTGAETVRHWVGGPNDPPIRIALVAETSADARDVLVEGESGILAISSDDNRPRYEPSNRRLIWPNGSMGITFSGEDPDQLRGPQFDKAWVDELAKYSRPKDTWDNLEFALRLGRNPQVVVSTTPRPIPIIRHMLEDPMTVVTRGSSYENIANLAPSFIRRVIQRYEGTRVGRQELHAEVLTDTPGSLWTYELIERLRVDRAPQFDRIVVAVDPAVSSTEDSDETGIIVAGRGEFDQHAYIIADLSGVMSPNEWAERVVAAFGRFGADKIVAERNQGGELVTQIVRTVMPNAPIKTVWASRGRVARAEPIAALYEQFKVHHIGSFSKLEDQMVSTTADGYQGGGSPDRMDAMVWALTELMFGSRILRADDFVTVRS